MNARIQPMTKVKQARLERRMKVADLAALVGIDQGQMSRIENGKQMPRSRARAEKIAEVLGIDPMDVVFSEPGEKAA